MINSARPQYNIFMAIKQRPTETNLIDRYEAWLERSAPPWLAKTLLLQDGGLLTPTENAHETRWFTKLLGCIALIGAILAAIDRFLL